MPYFPGVPFLYAVMVGLVLGLALTSGDWPQALRTQRRPALAV